MSDFEKIYRKINSLKNLLSERVFFKHKTFWERKTKKKEFFNEFERKNKNGKTTVMWTWDLGHKKLWPESYAYIFFRKAKEQLNSFLINLSTTISLYKEVSNKYAFQANVTVIFLLDRIVDFILVFMTLNYFENNYDDTKQDQNQMKLKTFWDKFSEIKQQNQKLCQIKHWRNKFFHNLTVQLDGRLTICPIGGLCWNSHPKSSFDPWVLLPIVEYDGRIRFRSLQYKVESKKIECNLLNLTEVVVEDLTRQLKCECEF